MVKFIEKTDLMYECIILENSYNTQCNCLLSHKQLKAVHADTNKDTHTHRNETPSHVCVISNMMILHKNKMNC